MNIYDLTLRDFLDLTKQFPDALSIVRSAINPPKKVVALGVPSPYPTNVQVINAIRGLRFDRRLGLKETKDLVEAGGYKVDVDSDLHKRLCSYGIQFKED